MKLGNVYHLPVTRTNTDMTTSKSSKKEIICSYIVLVKYQARIIQIMSAVTPDVEEVFISLDPDTRY